VLPNNYFFFLPAFFFFFFAATDFHLRSVLGSNPVAKNLEKSGRVWSVARVVVEIYFPGQF